MFDSITKNTVLITGCLIFLGYCKYYFYYNVFGIDIYNFISTAELLLSVIPIFIIFFLPVLFFVYLSMFRTEKKWIRKDGRDVTDRINLRMAKMNNPLILLRHIFLTKRLKKTVRLKLIVRLFLNSLFIAFCVLVFMTITLFIALFSDGTISAVEPLFYLVAAGWLCFVVEPFIFKEAMKKMPDRHFWVIKGANYFFIITFFIYSYQKFKAHEKLAGISTVSVAITFKTGAVISTTPYFVYLGQTNQYIFFRDLRDSTNTMYDMAGIEKTATKTLR